VFAQGNANTALDQSERALYLNYFIIGNSAMNFFTQCVFFYLAEGRLNPRSEVSGPFSRGMVQINPYDINYIKNTNKVMW
jgi:hypothetical protein